MIPYRLIRSKRDGAPLTREEMRALLDGFAAGDVPDYQMAAFLMATYFRGLDATELDTLVAAVIDSGVTVRFPDDGRRRIDKHSTGGVGDKVSLVLAPLVASLGVQVPMISGRGLGHTTGTVDKLEAIPGFRTQLDLAAFRRQVLDLGCALVGQTDELTPLDGRLYALRDVTATVDAIPLMAASIMSKKIAEGVDGLVLDVKRGGGAFLPELDDALELGRTMIRIGASHGVDVVALVTAMDRPLGRAVGNAVETAEAVRTLTGDGPEDLVEVTLALAAEMLMLGDAAPGRPEALERARTALEDGRAAAMMRRIIEAQGGDPGVVDDPDRLPRAPVTRVVTAEAGGRVHAVDARALGEAVLALGGGRRAMDAGIDPAVGFVLDVRPGSELEVGAPLGRVLAATEDDAEEGARALRGAVTLDDGQTEPLPLVSHRITARGVETLA